jgi:hypothetical protein
MNVQIMVENKEQPCETVYYLHEQIVYMRLHCIFWGYYLIFNRDNLLSRIALWQEQEFIQLTASFLPYFPTI